MAKLTGSVSADGAGFGGSVTGFVDAVGNSFHGTVQGLAEALGIPFFGNVQGLAKALGIPFFGTVGGTAIFSGVFSGVVSGIANIGGGGGGGSSVSSVAKALLGSGAGSFESQKVFVDPTQVLISQEIPSMPKLPESMQQAQILPTSTVNNNQPNINIEINIDSSDIEGKTSREIGTNIGEAMADELEKQLRRLGG
jgi:hypothetical protein